LRRKNLIFLLLIILLAFAVTGCTKKESNVIKAAYLGKGKASPSKVVSQQNKAYMRDGK